MHQIKPDIFIFSPERNNLTDSENYDRVEECRGLLERSAVGYKQVLDCYKGKKEVAFLVTGLSAEHTVKSLSSYFDQECYLKSDCEHDATLVYKDGSEERIGKLIQVSEVEAKLHPAYTYDESTNSYWVCK